MTSHITTRSSKNSSRGHEYERDLAETSSVSIENVNNN